MFEKLAIMALVLLNQFNIVSEGQNIDFLERFIKKESLQSNLLLEDNQRRHYQDDFFTEHALEPLPYKVGGVSDVGMGVSIASFFR